MTKHRRTGLTLAAATAATGLALITMTGASARSAPVARPAAATRPGAGPEVPSPTVPAPRVTLVARLPVGDAEIDASPDPSGRTIYFTTDGPGGPGIFRVPAAGGPYQPVLVGPPLRGPSELAVSNDGAELFVADRAAGEILVEPVTGGMPRVLRGTAGSAPRGVELETLDGQDYVVYTGRDPHTGRPALLRVSVAGAARPAVVFEGLPLRSPDGVAVSRTGVIYVTDQGGSQGRVLRIDGRRVRTVATGVTLGRPGGVALTLDESKLLVSSLNPVTRTAQVLIVDTRSGLTTTFDGVIGANRMAGGLHRARDASSLGWAGVSRDGLIYRIDP
jgi:hypothetical protein